MTSQGSEEKSETPSAFSEGATSKEEGPSQPTDRSDGHQELLEFGSEERQTPPSTFAPLYLGGAADTPEYTSYNPFIAKRLYDYTVKNPKPLAWWSEGLDTENMAPSSEHEGAEDAWDHIDNLMRLGSQVNCGCTAPLLYPLRYNNPSYPFRSLVNDLVSNDPDSCMDNMTELTQKWPELWRKKMECNKPNCVQFRERCKEVASNWAAENARPIPLALFPQWFVSSSNGQLV